MLDLEWASLNKEQLGFFYWDSDRDCWKRVRSRLGACARPAWRKPPDLEGQLIVFPFHRLCKLEFKRLHSSQSFAFIKGVTYIPFTSQSYS